MLIDITFKITPKIAKSDTTNQNPSLMGHLGTHFDVMDEEFPLAYTKRRGVVFDVSGIKDRDIDICDIDLDRIEKDMFILFSSGYIEKKEYGTKDYFAEHPQLSHRLIEALLLREISIIGLDFGGIRRGKEHVPTDRYCAQRGTFIIENLCNLSALPPSPATFLVHTYPMCFEGITGLPCRVIAEIE